MNPFQTGNKRPKEIQERINAANAEANELIENAKLCLADEKFQQFKESYAKVFSNLIQIMLELPREDDRIFSATIDSLRVKVQVLQGFGFRIEDAAHAPKRPIAPTTADEVKAS